MKKTVLIFLLFLTNALADLETKGHVDVQLQSYLTRAQDKHPDNFTASAQVELDYTQEDLELIAKASAQADSYDFTGSSKHNDRSFVRLDELYAKYELEDSQFMAGKSIRFWGALEVDNITDVFNPDDFRTDIFNADKLGVWNMAYTHYTDTGELALIIKIDEPDQDMASLPYVYYFFPSFVNYDKNLQSEKSKNRPSVYLKYSGSTETEYPLDYAFIIENGYDSQRYFSSDAAFNFTQHAYLVNKFMTYDTLVVGSTLFKLEALYTDVLNDEKVSDYYHIGLGVEHTLSQVYKQADLGLLAEYYKYDTVQKDRLSDLDIFETFENDLFLGARYSFNEGNDASVVGGVIFDLDYNEQSYYIEYEGRIAQTFKLNLDYRYIEPSKNSLTAFNLMGRHQRVSLKLGYYF